MLCNDITREISANTQYLESGLKENVLICGREYSQISRLSWQEVLLIASGYDTLCLQQQQHTFLFRERERTIVVQLFRSMVGSCLQLNCHWSEGGREGKEEGEGEGDRGGEKRREEVEDGEEGEGAATVAAALGGMCDKINRITKINFTSSTPSFPVLIPSQASWGAEDRQATTVTSSYKLLTPPARQLHLIHW